jgi:hypothetical protein
MDWKFEAQRHQTFTIKSAANFNQLVGRRLIVNVAEDEKGFHQIVGGRPYRTASDA